jgi:two-component system chemotaxis response regulator CheB
VSNRKIRVLIVDDSAVARHLLSAIMSTEPDIEVMATASDAFAAARRVQEEVPDVILLDVKMPRMDGITFLRKIMAQHPIPVIICSALTEDSALMFEAFEAGAVDFLPKPVSDQPRTLQESALRLREAVRAAVRVKLRTQGPRRAPIEAKLTADVIMPPPVEGRSRLATARIVCIGVSTGGTESLRDVLEKLPQRAPGILIVQHMPSGFTAAFAKRLNGLCEMQVKEAEDGDTVAQGCVYIAPGGRHMLLQRTGQRYHIAIKDGPPVSRHRPSADVLFRSAAQYAGRNALGIIMTGMGDDGARGLLEMRKFGASTRAQNEESCVVFGMPKEAIACGAVEKVVPLSQIAKEIMLWQDARQSVVAD